MELQVGKWGNSLAVRLPAEVARQLHVTDGAAVVAAFDQAGALTLKPVRPKFDKAAYLRDVRALTENKPLTREVMRELRDDARY